MGLGRVGAGPGDDVINNQSENWRAGRVWPAPEAEIVGSLKMSFPPSHITEPLCRALFPEVIFRLVLKQI